MRGSRLISGATLIVGSIVVSGLLFVHGSVLYRDYLTAEGGLVDQILAVGLAIAGCAVGIWVVNSEGRHRRG